jgi:hypothetical protein
MATDILARMRQLIGTTDEWEDNDIVIGDGELALERLDSGIVAAKVGNGEDAYTDLPYFASTFGAGYTWRAAASVTSGAARIAPDHPIQCNFVLHTSSSNDGAATITVDGLAVAVANAAGNGQMVLTGSAIVPPGATYSYSWSGGITNVYFYELRAD